ncbi:MAG: hypothetical protein ACPL5I_16550 [Thermodesulfobacteriota bacterium]
MKKAITKAQARDFKKRWEAINAWQRDELRKTSFMQKLQKLSALMISGKQMGWDKSLSIGEEEVRERWKRLKKECHETT